MEEYNEMTEEFKTRVADKVADKLSLNYNVTTDMTSLISRIEATNIIVSIINSFLTVRQKTDKKLSDDEINAIQYAVAVESQKTSELFEKLNKILNEQNDI